jgi:membrane protein CcdC involved in cytochrome C biogenesis
VPVGVAVAATYTGCWTYVVGVDRVSGVDVASAVAVGMAVFVVTGAMAVWV